MASPSLATDFKLFPADSHDSEPQDIVTRDFRGLPNDVRRGVVRDNVLDLYKLAAVAA